MNHINYPPGSNSYDLQTAVMQALINASHASHGPDWRSRADALLESLRAQGYQVSK